MGRTTPWPLDERPYLYRENRGSAVDGKPPYITWTCPHGCGYEVGWLYGIRADQAVIEITDHLIHGGVVHGRRAS